MDAAQKLGADADFASVPSPPSLLALQARAVGQKRRSVNLPEGDESVKLTATAAGNFRAPGA